MVDTQEPDGVLQVRSWRKQIEDANEGKSMAELVEYIKKGAETSELRRALNLKKAPTPVSPKPSD